MYREGKTLLLGSFPWSSSLCMTGQGFFVPLDQLDQKDERPLGSSITFKPKTRMQSPFARMSPKKRTGQELQTSETQARIYLTLATCPPCFMEHVFTCLVVCSPHLVVFVALGIFLSTSTT